MEREELMQSLGGLQARVDDAFNEQVSCNHSSISPLTSRSYSAESTRSGP